MAGFIIFFEFVPEEITVEFVEETIQRIQGDIQETCNEILSYLFFTPQRLKDARELRGMVEGWLEYLQELYEKKSNLILLLDFLEDDWKASYE